MHAAGRDAPAGGRFPITVRMRFFDLASLDPGMQRTENKLQFVGEKMPELKLRFAARSSTSASSIRRARSVSTLPARALGSGEMFRLRQHL